MSLNDTDDLINRYSEGTLYLIPMPLEIRIYGRGGLVPQIHQLERANLTEHREDNHQEGDALHRFVCQLVRIVILWECSVEDTVKIALQVEGFEREDLARLVREYEDNHKHFFELPELLFDQTDVSETVRVFERYLVDQRTKTYDGDLRFLEDASNQQQCGELQAYRDSGGKHLTLTLENIKTHLRWMVYEYHRDVFKRRASRFHIRTCPRIWEYDRDTMVALYTFL